MTRIEVSNELRGDLGELYFKHLCQQRGYGYVRLEDIFNNFGLDRLLEFKCGFDRIIVLVPEDVEDDIRDVCMPLDVNGTDSFAFDFLTVKLHPKDRDADFVQKKPEEFCWVEIKTGGSQLSKHQNEVREGCFIRFSLFRVSDVNVSPHNVEIKWEYDSGIWKP